MFVCPGAMPEKTFCTENGHKAYYSDTSGMLFYANESFLYLIGGAEGQSGGRITIHGCKIEATGGTGTDDTIIYLSSNEKVATVDENGNVKATRKGCCTVTATVEGTNISEEIKIKVSYTFIDAVIHYLNVVISFLEDIAFKWSV